MDEREEALLVDKLCSGDRPSVYVAGMAVANALRQEKIAVLMVDALGRVQVMAPGTVQVLKKPLLVDEELHAMPEEQALQVLVLEGRSDQEMLAYLHRREQANGSGVL